MNRRPVTTFNGGTIVEWLKKSELDEEARKIHPERTGTDILHGDEVAVRFMGQRPASRPDQSQGAWKVDLAFPHRVKVTIDTASCDEGHASLLHGLVLAIRPWNVFETGTHRGRSTQAIVSALVENNQGSCVSVDMNDYKSLPQCLTEEEQSRLQLVVGETPEIFGSDMFTDYKGIDFAHIDGDHAEEGLMADLTFVDERRATSCLVAVDNANDDGWPSVREALLKYDKYPKMTLPTMCGLELIWMHD